MRISLSKQLLFLGIFTTLTACSSQTQISGTVYNNLGNPLPKVTVKLGFNAENRVVTQTNLDGQFSVTLKEQCLILCAGGDPELSLSKPGYEPIVEYLPRFKKIKRKFHLKGISIKKDNDH